MGLEYQDVSLVEVYSKTDVSQKRIHERYGQQYRCKQGSVWQNKDFKSVSVNEQELVEEEHLLDEQKRF
jgi:hypothetical protein